MNCYPSELYKVLSKDFYSAVGYLEHSATSLFFINMYWEGAGLSAGMVLDDLEMTVLPCSLSVFLWLTHTPGRKEEHTPQSLGDEWRHCPPREDRNVSHVRQSFLLNEPSSLCL